MGLGKQTTSRKCWFGRRCFLLLSLCHLKSPRLSVLNNLGSCAVLSCAVRSWREEALALRLYLLDYCWSLHNSRDVVLKLLERLQTWEEGGLKGLEQQMLETIFAIGRQWMESILSEGALEERAS